MKGVAKIALLVVGSVAMLGLFVFLALAPQFRAIRAVEAKQLRLSTETNLFPQVAGEFASLMPLKTKWLQNDEPSFPALFKELGGDRVESHPSELRLNFGGGHVAYFGYSFAVNPTNSGQWTLSWYERDGQVTKKLLSSPTP